MIENAHTRKLLYHPPTGIYIKDIDYTLNISRLYANLLPVPEILERITSLLKELIAIGIDHADVHPDNILAENGNLYAIDFQSWILCPSDYTFVL